MKNKLFILLFSATIWSGFQLRDGDAQTTPMVSRFDDPILDYFNSQINSRYPFNKRTTCSDREYVEMKLATDRLAKRFNDLYSRSSSLRGKYSSYISSYDGSLQHQKGIQEIINVHEQMKGIHQELLNSQLPVICDADGYNSRFFIPYNIQGTTFYLEIIKTWEYETYQKLNVVEKIQDDN